MQACTYGGNALILPSAFSVFRMYQLPREVSVWLSCDGWIASCVFVPRLTTTGVDASYQKLKRKRRRAISGGAKAVFLPGLFLRSMLVTGTACPPPEWSAAHRSYPLLQQHPLVLLHELSRGENIRLDYCQRNVPDPS